MAPRYGAVDGVIVAMKAANKGARAPAESLELQDPDREESATHGHGPDPGSGSGDTRSGADTAVCKGAQLTARGHITTETLEAAYLALKRDAAPGVDGMTWREYGAELAGCSDLKDRVRHSGAYRAAPVRRVEIPKPAGACDSSGIASLEDKIVQRASRSWRPDIRVGVLRIQLRFRPGLGAQRAGCAGVRGGAAQGQLGSGGGHPPVLRSIEREQLMREMRIGDRRVLRLIRKWLNAGARSGAGGRRGEGDAAGGGDIAAAGGVPAPRAGRRFARRGGRGRPGARSTSCATPMTSCWGLSTGDAERFQCGSGSRVSGWNRTRRRRACWSRQVRESGPSAGSGVLRRSTFWASRTTAGREERGFRLGRKPVAKRVRRTLKASRLEEAYARAAGDDGDMAWAGATWVAWLLRSTDQLPGVTPVRTRRGSGCVLSVGGRSGPLLVGATRCAVRATVAARLHPPPVARPAICLTHSR